MTTSTARAAAEVDAAALLADAAKRCAVARAAPRAAGTPPPRPPRRSRACGRRPRRACRSRARARRSSAPRRARRAAPAAAARAAPSQSGAAGAHRPYPTKVPVTEQSTAQREAVTHPGGPLLILAGAGTGKTHALVERFAWLAEHGTPADAILALTFSTAAADDLRERIEARVAARATRSCRSRRSRRSARGCCARRRSRRASTRSPRPSPPADRLAMLLERIDELPLASHDLRGNPSALLGSIVQRIDRLKDELVTAGDYAAWAAKLPEDGEPAGRAPRASASSPRSTPPTTACSPRRARSTSATSCCTRSGSCAPSRTSAQRLARALPRTCSSTSSRTRASPRACCCGCSSPSTATSRPRPTTTRRSTASAAPSTKSRRRLPRGVAGRRRSCGWRRASASGERDPRRRARGRRSPTPSGSRSALAPARTRARSRSGAARTSARRRRPSPPTSSGWSRARTSRPRTCACSCARSSGEGQAVAAALEERAVPYRLSGAAAFFQRAEVRDLLAWLRLLVDPGDAGAVVRALARPPIELRAIDLARCTQIARRRKLDMVAALGAALESPQIPPEARERIARFLKLYRVAAGHAGLDAPRPLRAPADRAARPAPPAAVRRLDRGRRAARQPGEVRRARRRLPAPLAAGDRARVRPLDRRGRRRRACARRRRSPASARAACR